MPPPFGNIPEKPSRVLFVRNINYTASDKEVREVFEKYGDVIDVFSRIGSRGMAFVTFSDIRDAEVALHKLQGTVIKDREIDVHYSLPRDANDKFNDRPESQQNDTLFISVRGCTTAVPNDEIHRIFSRFGDIKEIRDCPKSPGQKFVEYYDLRACQNALKELNNTEIPEGILDIKFATEKRRDTGGQSGRHSRGGDRGGRHSDSYSHKRGGGSDYSDSHSGGGGRQSDRSHRDQRHSGGRFRDRDSGFGGQARSFGGGNERSGYSRGSSYGDDGRGRDDSRDREYDSRGGDSGYSNPGRGLGARGTYYREGESQWDQRGDSPYQDSYSARTGGYSQNQSYGDEQDDSSSRYHSGGGRGSHRMMSDPYPSSSGRGGSSSGGSGRYGDPRRPPPPRVEGAMNNLTSLLKEQASYHDPYSQGSAGGKSDSPYGHSQYSPNMNNMPNQGGNPTLGALANLYQAASHGAGGVGYSPPGGAGGQYAQGNAGGMNYGPGGVPPANAQLLLNNIIGQLQQTAYSQSLLNAALQNPQNPQNPLAPSGALNPAVGGLNVDQQQYQPSDPSYGAFNPLAPGSTSGGAGGYSGLPNLNSNPLNSGTGANDYNQPSSQSYHYSQQNYSQPSSSSSASRDSYNSSNTGGSGRYS